MISKVRLTTLLLLLVVSSLSLHLGCSKSKPTELASFPTSHQVFLDEFGPNATFEAFLGSKLDALDVDATASQAGTRSLVVTVPDEGDPSGSFAGGAFTTTVGRDLTQFNALTFWAKASIAATINVVGLGNDNTGSSRFGAEVNDLPVSTTWSKFVIPIPDPTKLVAERGLFYFAEGPEDGSGYKLWFDEVQFETLGTISNPEPSIPTVSVEEELDDTLTFDNGSVIFDVDGAPVTVSAMSAYFTFISSDTTVVKVAGNGIVSSVGLGLTELTATLGTVPASGAISVTVVPPTAVPTSPAPTPTVPSADVISLYSNAYSNITVNTWSADWDRADVFDQMVGTDDVKKYEYLLFAGIDFSTPTVDASALTHFHIDAWTPVAVSSSTELKIKLVDFGADGVFSVDDVEHELVFSESSIPALVSGSWMSFDLPLAAFTGLTTTGHLAQLVISGTQLPIVYVDNMYWYDAGTPTKPLVPASAPTQPSVNVISLFSDAYNDVTIDTWSADWDNAYVSDETVGADNVKKYTGLNEAGIEFTSSTIDGSNMSILHLDVWTPSPTDLPAALKIKLVDFGADGVWSGAGGDDVEHELTFDRNSTPALVTGSWISFDIPLADFTNLTTTGHLAQLIISGQSSTVFVDNIYFYTEGPQEPPSPAPVPTVSAIDVISLFSDAYTDVPVDTWSADHWPDEADVEDYVIGTDNTKKYTNLVYAGIEFLATSTVDASAMSHFHMDVWTPDVTDAPATFRIKLVDFGANGNYDGGGLDDVEHELTFDESTMNTGSWVSIDVELTDFVDLTTRAHLAQMIISSDPNTVFIDNVYFYDAHLATAPAASAPTPSVDAANVISLFSDAYTNWTVDTWSTFFDAADVANYTIGADSIKEYTNLNYAYIEFRTSTIDALTMTHFHIDVWTPDRTAAPAVLKVKLIDFGADGALGGGDDVSGEVIFDESTMNTRSWVSIDVPLSAFTDLTTKGHVGQLVITSTPNTMFVDNVYFYK